MRINGAIIKKALPTILTVAAAVGVGVTGYLAHKGTKKADEILSEFPESEKLETDEKEIAKEELKRTWKCYIPAAVVGSATIGCIVASHVMSVREIAALTATCTYLVKNRDRLEKKLKEAVGEEKYNEIKKKLVGEEGKLTLAKKEIKEAFHQTIEDTGNGAEHDKILCFEGYSGRWFYSTREAVVKAENRLNEMFGAEKYCCLNDFYQFLGIERTHFGYQFGWVNHPDYYDGPIFFDNTKVFYEELGCDVLIIEIQTYPMECWQEI